MYPISPIYAIKIGNDTVHVKSRISEFVNVGGVSCDFAPVPTFGPEPLILLSARDGWAVCFGLPSNFGYIASSLLHISGNNRNRKLDDGYQTLIDRHSLEDLM